MDHGTYCDLTEIEIARLVAAVAAADPEAAVPGCDGWTVKELAVHVGTVHRWATHIVATQAAERVSVRDLDLHVPEDPAALPGWLTEGGVALAAALRAADGDSPVWVWGADRHQRFWSRRQFHETLVHRADAERAAGTAPLIAVDAALDCVDEFLENIGHLRAAAPAIAALNGAGETLHFHATDAAGEWMITLEPGGFRWERGHGKGDVAVRGPLTELLLLILGRRSSEGLEVFGDADLLNRWLTATKF